MLSSGLGSRSKMETRGEKAGGLRDGKSLRRLGLEGGINEEKMLKVLQGGAWLHLLEFITNCTLIFKKINE